MSQYRIVVVVGSLRRDSFNLDSSRMPWSSSARLTSHFNKLH